MLWSGKASGKVDCVIVDNRRQRIVLILCRSWWILAMKSQCENDGLGKVGEKCERVFPFSPTRRESACGWEKKQMAIFHQHNWTLFLQPACVITRCFFSFFLFSLHPHSLGPLPPYYYASENFIFSPTREFVLGSELAACFFLRRVSFYVPKSLSHNSESDENVSCEAEKFVWEWKCCEIEFGLRTEHSQKFPFWENMISPKNECWSLFVGPTHARGSYEYDDDDDDFQKGSTLSAY